MYRHPNEKRNIACRSTVSAEPLGGIDYVWRAGSGPARFRSGLVSMRVMVSSATESTKFRFHFLHKAS
jgi:hypothetical protein